MSWIDWGIGGLSLYIGDSSITSETAYTNKIVANENGQGVNGVSPPYAADRAAIGYKSGNIVVLANIVNATPYEVRSVMTSLGCLDAIMLDGSNATQMRAKDAAGAVKTYGGGRAIYSIVTVNGATWQ